jgi:hypothetical protein
VAKFREKTELILHKIPDLSLIPGKNNGDIVENNDPNCINNKGQRNSISSNPDMNPQKSKRTYPNRSHSINHDNGNINRNQNYNRRSNYRYSTSPVPNRHISYFPSQENRYFNNKYYGYRDMTNWRPLYTNNQYHGLPETVAQHLPYPLSGRPCNLPWGFYLNQI